MWRNPSSARSGTSLSAFSGWRGPSPGHRILDGHHPRRSLTFYGRAWARTRDLSRVKPFREGAKRPGKAETGPRPSRIDWAAEMPKTIACRGQMLNEGRHYEF